MATLASPNLLQWRYHQVDETTNYFTKGDYPMLKIAVRYTRYALLVLTTVGFGGPVGHN
jgi:hypothetical protein